MTYEEKKREFEKFCVKKRWYRNIPDFASTFFGVSEAAIKKWQSANGKIPDSAINLMFTEYKVLELQEKIEKIEDDFSYFKTKVRAFYRLEKEIKEIAKQ